MIRLTSLFAAAALATVGFTGAAAAQTISFTSLPHGSIINLQATIISKMLLSETDLRVRVTPMRGTEAQLSALERGEAEFMLVDVTQAAAAVLGLEAWEGRPVKNVRAALRLLPFTVGVVVQKDAPFKQIADLKGARLPSGWTAFQQGAILTQAILANAGMTMDDVRGVPTPEVIRAADDFKAGRMDATMIAPPTPKLREVEAAIGGVRFLPLDDSPEALARVREVRQDFYIMEVQPGPAAPGVLEPTNLLAFDLAVAVGTHVPDETVRKVIEAIYDHHGQLASEHPSFRGFDPKQAAKEFAALEYHPGAIAFYREKGLWPGS